MKCLIFALTGFGNAALDGILDAGVFGSVSVVTRSEKGPFPYYSCENLMHVCRSVGVPVISDVDLGSESDIKQIESIHPDLILVATFDQILPEHILRLPRYGTVNIHPSLLPKYRGPTPSNWAVVHGDKISGITYHRMTDKIDMGDILWQESISIQNMTDGQVRLLLAQLTEDTIGGFLSHYLKHDLRPIERGNCDGSYFPKVTSAEGIALLRSGRFSHENILRGLSPYPGVQILREES
jgi:methionyl-tRNA formyltransferase